MRHVLDAINAIFKKYFEPHQNVFIDESMVGMKNRITYLQYMPNKQHSRFRIKKFELCDAVSGYVLHVELYAGKDFPIRSDPGQAHAVVVDLMTKDNLLNKGYHLFTITFIQSQCWHRRSWEQEHCSVERFGETREEFPCAIQDR